MIKVNCHTSPTDWEIKGNLERKFSNDIRIALKICSDDYLLKGFGDLIKIDLAQSEAIDSPLNNSKIITNFHNLVKQISNSITHNKGNSEIAFYKRGEKIQIEDIMVKPSIFLGLGDEPEYDIEAIEVGVPFLYKYIKPIERQIRLYFRESHLNLLYFDTFSRKENDIIKKMHCRLGNIIRSVDSLRGLRCDPDYRLYICVSSNTSNPTGKEILEKLNEDVKKTHHKMHLLAKPEQDSSLGGYLNDTEALICASTPKPTYTTLVEVLKDGLRV